MHSRCCWPPERLIDDLVELAAIGGKTVNARPVGHVFVDRLRKRIRLLEHHADTGSQLHHVLLLVVNILPVQSDVAFDPSTYDGVIHAV
jgi:hypothetical protein